MQNAIEAVEGKRRLHPTLTNENNASMMQMIALAQTNVCADKKASAVQERDENPV